MWGGVRFLCAQAWLRVEGVLTLYAHTLLQARSTTTCTTTTPCCALSRTTSTWATSAATTLPRRRTASRKQPCGRSGDVVRLWLRVVVEEEWLMFVPCSCYFPLLHCRRHLNNIYPHGVWIRVYEDVHWCRVGLGVQCSTLYISIQSRGCIHWTLHLTRHSLRNLHRTSLQHT